ncbi:MAG TPA: hypothetical protein VFE94_04305 [Candidatus Paceibacterota bacterium]|nr:hypothetical protein [Candidatus Paceibacterota bacterium]
MNYFAGAIVFLVGFSIAIAVLLGCIAINKYLKGKSYRKIDVNVLALLVTGTIPMGLTVASWEVFQGLRPYFLYASLLWGITFGLSSFVWLCISLMSPIFYLGGRLKDSWLDFWFQLLDPAGWENRFAFPYGRRLRTLRQSAKAGHFDLEQLPFVMWVNKQLGTGPGSKGKK